MRSTRRAGVSALDLMSSSGREEGGRRRCWKKGGKMVAKWARDVEANATGKYGTYSVSAVRG